MRYLTALLARSKKSSALRATNVLQSKRRRRRLFVEQLEDRRLLATFTVINLADSGTGSLRQAIVDANVNLGNDIIQFASGVSGTITLTSGELAINDAVDLQGPGASVLAISGNNASRVFYVSANVTISGLTISGGNSSIGAGIYNDASTLTVNSISFAGNIGGGIYNTGILTVVDSNFVGNTGVNFSGARSGTISAFAGLGTNYSTTYSTLVGSGIYNSNGGMATCSGCDFSSNTGSGIFNDSTVTLPTKALTVAGSTFTANIGGGIVNSGSLEVSDTHFTSNTGGTLRTVFSFLSSDDTFWVGSGIGNYNGGVATVSRSTFDNNHGSAIFNYFATSVVTGSTFTNNESGYGGGIYSFLGVLKVNESTFVHNSAVGFYFGAGGGICVFPGETLEISNSTFSDNLAGYNQAGVQISNGHGGAISVAFAGAVDITNSTISGNKAYSFGGGIFNYRSILMVTNSTISGNSVIFGRPDVAGSGGGIWAGGQTTTYGNTIIAGNSAPTIGIDFSGGPTSYGYNLIGTGRSSRWISSDLIRPIGGLPLDPMLAPLANYGGPTWTMALLPGSLAIDVGSASAGPTTDQRGGPRINGTRMDIGAFESSGPGLVVSGSSDSDRITVEPGSLNGLKTTVTNLNTNISVVNDNITVDGILYVKGLGGNDQFIITKSLAGHVVLDGGEGSDDYNISFGNLAGTVVVGDKGAGVTDFDTLTVNGTSAKDTLAKAGGFIKWRPTGQPAYLEEVDFNGMEHVTLVAGAGNDTIHDPNSHDVTILGGPGDDTITIADTIGLVTVDGGDGSDTYIIPVANLQGPVSIIDTGTIGTDVVNVQGTIGNDTIAIAGNQVVANGTTISLVGAEALAVDGRAGANSYTVTMGNLATPVTINNTTGTSSLTVIAPPGSNTLTLSATQLSGAGETINLNLGTTATNVTVDGSAGTNQLVLQGPPPGPVTVVQINVAPVLDTLSATSVNENGTVHLTGTYHDMDTQDTHTLTINWGEGLPQTVTVSGGSFDVTHQYLDDNPTNTASDVYTIGVTLTDNHQGVTTKSTTTTITNVAPVLDTPSATSVLENGTVHLTGTYHDVGTQDTHTLTINWGEGLPQTVPVSGGSFDVTHQYLDDNPTNSPTDIYFIGVTLTDDDQGVTTKSTTTTITNEAPVFVGFITGPATAVPGQIVSYSAAFTDVGTLDSHTVTINWGDSNTTTLGTVSERIGTGVGTAMGSHTYAGHGTYTITFTLTDDDLGVTTKSTSVAANPSIFVLHSTAAGAFTASGNGSINVTGVVVVDSNSPTAITASGNVRLTASNFDVVGGIKTTGNAQLIGPVTHTFVPDPLAGLATPALGTVQAAVIVSGNSSRTINPGTYSSISVSGNGLLTLNPGVYILAGGGFSVSGNGSVTGSGVSIVNSASATGSTGSISFSGTGAVTLTPTSSGPLTGILIFQPANNTKALTISGNAATGLNGTIYAPKARLDIIGNGNLTETIIVDQLTLSGSGSNLAAASVASPAATSNSSRMVTSNPKGVEGLSLTTYDHSQLTNIAYVEEINRSDQLFASLATAPAKLGLLRPITVHKSLSDAREILEPADWNLLGEDFLDAIALARSTMK